MTLPTVFALASALLLVAALGGCALDAAHADSAGAADAPVPIAMTRMEDGSLTLVDAQTFAVVKRFAGTEAAAPMHLAVDVKRRCFYVGNFRGGVARAPFDGGEPQVLDVGGAVIGLAVDPRGALLAVNGAKDLKVRFVDLERFQVVATTELGAADDAPKHSHLTHGLKSTHVYWEPDGAAIVTEDNVHEVLLRVARDGAILARAAMPAGVHSLVALPDGRRAAIGEGAVDGSAPPYVAFLRGSDLAVERTTPLKLLDGEKAKLHHADLRDDGALLVVANMGPMHGAGAGRAVHAIDPRSGEVRWTAAGPTNAGHVRFLDRDRVVVVGHQDRALVVLATNDGARLATWTVDATALGHAVQLDPDDTLVLVDAEHGRLLRLKNGATIASSPPLGEGTWEASLKE